MKYYLEELELVELEKSISLETHIHRFVLQLWMQYNRPGLIRHKLMEVYVELTPGAVETHILLRMGHLRRGI